MEIGNNMSKKYTDKQIKFIREKQKLFGNKINTQDKISFYSCELNPPPYSELVTEDSDVELKEKIYYVIEHFNDMSLENDDIYFHENNESELYDMLSNIPFYFTTFSFKKFEIIDIISIVDKYGYCRNCLNFFGSKSKNKKVKMFTGMCNGTQINDVNDVPYRQPSKNTVTKNKHLFFVLQNYRCKNWYPIQKIENRIDANNNLKIFHYCKKNKCSVKKMNNQEPIFKYL